MAGATMADVARAAGVSKQTVSRVINAHPSVTEATRTRVKDAIDRLGYRPNVAARQLAMRDSMTVGVLTADLALYGPAQLVQGVEEAARARGYFTSIAGIASTPSSGTDEILERFFAQRFDAVILLDVNDQLLARTSGLSGTRHVISAPLGSTHDDFWQHDRTAVREATEYLISLGHTRIAHIGGPSMWPSARERERGWRDALDAAGLPAIPVVRSTWSAEGGSSAGEELAANGAVTAVVAASDDIALGAISALTRRGRRVPDDVSVIGFDGTPSSAFFIPSLTTVSCDFRALGARYVDALSVELGEEVGPHEESWTELVVRGSTARRLERV
ncbi:LacI family DNA-binding transcriptional regulator [Salana multivorans]|uniref:LacI family DNA-binding transcriptional regulator n=1 Tax=Salana multivorans TaxID=120377 RepID=UPI000A7FFA5C|nr:LacI family DNA-binding transcriptional regulator [Salana multivorans]